ncbi:MAG TPA: hypothetical protein VJ976_08120 [Ornithinimicrobium sp.]|uniref:hypothetical protein n=1 Tax=Ornithinimicrobium sp. TaxID=1977084 RepID=UPI002B467ACF|nr:hypothetical protein [Ornithinimicrobium sp.]HKJ12338.1 hypothetical protein [Ornithinimicrobium sp.]
MTNTAINSVFATPHSKNAWAYPASESSWRKIKGNSTDGVSNTFLLLALARAHNRSANVTIASNEITEVYL